mmetsp:Transcript_4214/g.8694  ORF Transcript_4214/g.8694 Transcript_4214/m.8694 type:complete len:212 (+) Transcript_4214:382-1017(+)
MSGGRAAGAQRATPRATLADPPDGGNRGKHIVHHTWSFTVCDIEGDKTLASDSLQYCPALCPGRLVALGGPQDAGLCLHPVLDFHVQLLQRSQVRQLHHDGDVERLCRLPDGHHTRRAAVHAAAHCQEGLHLSGVRAGHAPLTVSRLLRHSIRAVGSRRRQRRAHGQTAALRSPADQDFLQLGEGWARVPDRPGRHREPPGGPPQRHFASP